MLFYRDRTQKAKEVAMHYAKEHADDAVQLIVAGERDVKSKEEAIALCEFLWEMVNHAAEDAENRVEVAGESNVQFWVEKMYNIIYGHLGDIGYLEEWENVCDKY